jgi:hypothetical protein
MAPLIVDRIEVYMSLEQRSKLSNIKHIIADNSDQSTIANVAEKWLQLKFDSLRLQVEKLQQYQATYEMLSSQDNSKLQIIRIKRRKRIVLDDLKETRRLHESYNEAFEAIESMTIMHSGIPDRYEQREFRDVVMDYYDASSFGSATYSSAQNYCSVTGWAPAFVVKCVDLVSRRLPLGAVGYLFGVQEISLFDPRNGKFPWHHLAWTC